MSFATFQSFNLYFYRYDDDPIVNSINNLEKLNSFIQDKKPQQIYKSSQN